MGQEDGDEDALTRWYIDRFGEARHPEEVQGYWLFVAGAALALVAVLIYVVGDASQPETVQAAVVFGGVAVPTLMVAVVYRLPVDRNVDRAAVVGAIVCFGAVGGFVYFYPTGWNLPADDPAPDRAAVVTAVYGVGLLILTAAAVGLPSVTDRREPEPMGGDSEAQFEVFEDRRGEWRWSLRDDEGSIIADSGEGYTSRPNARRGLEDVRENVDTARVTERRAEEATEDIDEDDVDNGETKAKYQVYEDENREWRWRLVAPDGRILADSGEGYASRQGAVASIEVVRDEARDADHFDFDPAGFEVYGSREHGWGWRFFAPDGDIVVGSTGYDERSEAVETVDAVRAGKADTEVYEDEEDGYGWRLIVDDDTIGETGGRYATEIEAREAARRFEEVAADADEVGSGETFLTVYEDKAGEWRWRLVDRGRVVADSGEGYTERDDVVEALERVKECSTAPIE